MMRKIEIYQFKHKLRREANLPDLEQIKHLWGKLQSKEEEREKEVVTLKGKKQKQCAKIIHRENEESKANQYMMHDTWKNTMEN